MFQDEHSWARFRVTRRAAMARALAAGYRGYLTFEYFHPWMHYPEALVYHTSDALDRMLRRPIAVAANDTG